MQSEDLNQSYKTRTKSPLEQVFIQVPGDIHEYLDDMMEITRLDKYVSYIFSSPNSSKERLSSLYTN